MPRVSVVVPIYNVERYLTDCLESLAHQTLTDLEVVMVDDGSTDSSAAIAAAFAAKDDRFVLVQQPNGGLGHARNTGAARATGEYVAFVDSDDVVVRHAYELLAGSLDRTGSDFATGNFHRLTTVGTRQAGMVSTVFHASRPRTHITKHPALLNDRTAWNKLFRRSFWEQHAFRWPEGVLYEDIPVTLPAHVLAKTVDVIREPVYLWRARVGDSSSITQRRTELRAIRDRFNAVDGVSRFLAEQGQHELKAKYDRSVAEQDLRYFLQELDEADDAFRALFLELVNDFFDRARPDVFDDLPAIDRLKWHLVRRRLMPELLEVLRFGKSGEIGWTPVIRKGRRFWGDYPFREDTALAIPQSIYRLGRDELPLRAQIEDIWWEDDVLHLRGFAYIAFLDLSQQRSARIRMTLEESGHPERVAALTVRSVRRPDVTDAAPDGLACYDWSGFEATLPVAALRHRGRFREGGWRLRIEVRSHGITRRKWLGATVPGRAKRPPWLMRDGARIIPTTPAGNFAIEVSTAPAEVTDARLDRQVLELAGTLHGRRLDPATAELRAARADGTSVLHLPVATGGSPTDGGTPFVSRVDLGLLASRTEVGDEVAHTEDLADGVVWELSLLPDDSGTRIPLSAGVELPAPRLDLGPFEMVLQPTRVGRLELVERRRRPEAEAVALTDDGWLELAGRYAEPTGRDTLLVLRAVEHDVERAVPMTRDGDRFAVRLRPGAVPGRGGDLPLGEDQWDLYARAADGSGPLVRLKLDRALHDRLPLRRVDGARETKVVDVDHDCLALLVSGDLPSDQRGRAGQRRLQERDYPALLGSPLLEQVLVDAYGAGRYAEDARAVTEALRGRLPGLAVVWSVVDGQAALPEGVHAVPRYGRDWYEARARSRFVLATDRYGVADLPPRAGQTVLQTWHGSPVTAVGLDDERAGARLGRGWEDRLRAEAARWDLLVSGSPAASEILRRAFGYVGEVAETGLPRHDLLVAGTEDRRRAARETLGLDPGRRVVLYAPTYRPDLTAGRDRYRLDLLLDLDALRHDLDDEVLLVRAHPKVVDTVLSADGRRVVDVSEVPDARELLLAADVLVTDYSSLMVDFAVTGRPMVFFAPDLEHYRSHLRSLYVDPGNLPGPVVADQAQLLDAVRAAPDEPGEHADRYAGFRATWTPYADGGATARVVDALLARE